MLQAAARFIDFVAQLLDARQHGIEGGERAAGGVGDNPGQGGLARSGRSVEYYGRELVGLDGAPQQPTWTDDVILSYVFVQSPGAHPERQRLAFILDRLRKQVHRLTFPEMPTTEDRPSHRCLPSP